MKSIYLTLLLLVIACSVAFAQQPEFVWADQVINYSSQKDYHSSSAKEALGEPNSMPSKGYSATAWEASGDDRREFLQLGFSKPIKIRQVVIAENCNPGAVVKVVLYDTENIEHEVFKQVADTLEQFSRFLYIKMDQTPYQVKAIKISIDCRAIPGPNQIDAVGIADHQEPLVSEIKTSTTLPAGLVIENLGPNVNSAYEEVNPQISPDGKMLFINRKDFPPHVDDDEIWISQADSNGNWGPVTNIGTPLNNSNHNFVSSVTPDGNTLLLGNQYFKDPSAYGQGFALSNRTGTGWEFPQNARIKNFVNTDQYINFYLSNDKKKVFMNVRREDTRGSSDLYVSFLQEDGSWSEPKNLGSELNSQGRECCAFLASDNKTLYFASDGYNGFGSHDIYVSTRLDDSWQKWSEPLNIGPPVNSAGWDAYYTIPAKGDFAYFVRDGDIYRIRTVEETKPEPVVLIYGTVFNQKTSKPVGNAKIRYEYLSNGNEAGIAVSTPATGEYKIVLPAGHLYGILASLDGFASVSDNFAADSISEYAEIRRDLYLVPVETGEVVRLNNIFFEFAKASLMKESEPELNRVVKLMNDNPGMNIRISGHTDHIGNETDNQKLSEDRARAVATYLTDKGISPARISSEGFGESRPVTGETTDEGRAMNRRVEFTIVKI